MALKMKYFVLKPKAKARMDLYARASQRALHAYANIIASLDPKMASELHNWAQRCAREQFTLSEEPE